MNFVLAAGGTGGHMVPAHALAAELRKRGHGVLLITDDRGARFPGLFAWRAGPHPSGRKAPQEPARADPRRALACSPAGARRRGSTRTIARTRWSASAAIPLFPALLAASGMGIPTVLHEQNAVLGRANRFLSGEAAAIATAYTQVDRMKRAL